MNIPLGATYLKGMKWKRGWPGESPPDPLLPTLWHSSIESCFVYNDGDLIRRILETPFWERRQWEMDRRREVEWEDIDYCLVLLVPIYFASLSEFGPRFTIPLNLSAIQRLDMTWSDTPVTTSKPLFLKMRLTEWSYAY